MKKHFSELTRSECKKILIDGYDALHTASLREFQMIVGLAMSAGLVSPEKLPEAPEELGKVPRLAVILEGGLVAGVVTSVPALQGEPVMVIDYDDDGAADEDLTWIEQPDGSEAAAIVHVESAAEAKIDLATIYHSLRE